MIFSRSLKFLFTTSQALPNAKIYIEKFSKLQVELVNQQKKLQELSHQVELAERANKVTFLDNVSKAISKLSGGTHENEATKELRRELISFKNDLEKKIEECDRKWEKPREEVKNLRKEISNNFLSKFVTLEEKLLRNCSLKDTSPELIEGFNLIHRLLLSVLEKHGVEFFEIEKEGEFNKEECESVDMENEEEMKKGKVKVKEVVSRGWKIDGIVIKKCVVRLE